MHTVPGSTGTRKQNHPIEAASGGSVDTVHATASLRCPLATPPGQVRRSCREKRRGALRPPLAVYPNMIFENGVAETSPAPQGPSLPGRSFGAAAATRRRRCGQARASFVQRRLTAPKRHHVAQNNPKPCSQKHRTTTKTQILFSTYTENEGAFTDSRPAFPQ